MIRNAHERPEGMDVGTIIMSGTNPVDIMKAVEVSVKTSRAEIVPDYDVENVSDKMIKIILKFVQKMN